MDVLHDHSPAIDVDAEIARIMLRREMRLERQDPGIGFSYWRLALAGSLTGVGIVAAGIIIGLALIRAIH